MGKRWDLKTILNKNKQDTRILSIYSTLIVQILATEKIFQTKNFWSSDNYFYGYSIIIGEWGFKKLFSTKTSEVFRF